MSIRRTRQQKMKAAVRREERAVTYQPRVESTSTTPVPVAKKADSHDQKYFFADLRKTAFSTAIILALLGFAYWTLVLR